MIKDNEKVLAIDIGASSIKICEFQCTEDGGMFLVDYVCHECHEEQQLEENDRVKNLADRLDQILREKKFEAKKVTVGLSGALAFYRFVKLPPIEDKQRIEQMIEYEVCQNIPIPLEEITWDYQLFSRPSSGDLEAVLVMVKTSYLEKFISVVSKNGYTVTLTEVSAFSTYNMARSNFIGEEQCEVIIDIGGHSTDLIFLDANQFFIRSIPVSGFSITQQIAKNFDVTIEQAEEMKHLHGFVSLGGNYAEATSEVATKISKIIRNTMTRLHSEIVRSINLYRSTQSGGKPTKVYLTGGSSIMEFTDRFFEEKLHIPVEYLNPFNSVAVDDLSVNMSSLQDVAHMLSSAIGLGMRSCVRCPVELKLLPAAQKQVKEFSKKKPLLLSASILLAFGGFIFYSGQSIRLDKFKDANKTAKKLLNENQKKKNTIDEQKAAIEKTNKSFEKLEVLLKDRYKWSSTYENISKIIPNYMWVNSITPIYSSYANAADANNAKKENKSEPPKVHNDILADNGDPIVGFELELGIINLKELKNFPDAKSKYGAFKTYSAVYEEFERLLKDSEANGGIFKGNVVELLALSPRKEAKGLASCKVRLDLKEDQYIRIPVYAEESKKTKVDAKPKRPAKSTNW